MADSNRTQLSYVAESTFGEKVAGSALQILRYSRCDLKLTVDQEESDEIVTNRQLADIAPIRHGVGGGFDFNLSYGSYDDLFAAAMGSAGFSSGVTVSAATISASSVDNSFNDSGNGFGAIVANQWIKTSGFADAANNGYFKVTSAAAGKLIVSGGTLTTVIATPTITVYMGPQITDGTTETTYNFEEYFSDLSSQLTVFKGCGISGFNVALPAEGRVTGRFNIVGATEEPLTSSAGSGYTAATTTRIFYDTHLDKIVENATALTVHSWSIDYSQVLNNQTNAGSTVPDGITQGSITCKGRIELYFATSTLYSKFVNNTESSLAVVFEDAAGNGMVIEIPEVIFTDGGRVIEGKDGDIMVDMEWSARSDATESIMCRIAKFAA